MRPPLNPPLLCGGYVFPVGVIPEISTFKVIFDLEGKGQSLAAPPPKKKKTKKQKKTKKNKQTNKQTKPPKKTTQKTKKTIGIITKLFCTSGTNLVVLAWMGEECGQAQNGVNLDLNMKGRSLHNAWTGLELLHGQASDWHTDRQSDRQTERKRDRQTHTHGCRQRQYPKAKTGLGISQFQLLSIRLVYEGKVCAHGSGYRALGIWKKIKDRHKIGLTLYVLSFFKGNINIYLHFVSFLHIDATQVVEILPQIRQEPTYST